jgi:hypothetical protein
MPLSSEFRLHDFLFVAAVVVVICLLAAIVMFFTKARLRGRAVDFRFESPGTAQCSRRHGSRPWIPAYRP